MCGKIGKIFRNLFLVSALLLAAGAPVSAASRYVVQKFSFDARGFLTAPLTVDFGRETKNLHVEEIPQGANSRLLLIVFPSGDGDVAVLRLSGSRAYSIYKANLRDNSREEVIVLGLGAAGDKSVRLSEIAILGENQAGAIQLMPVNGFVPSDVLNAPLQLDGARDIILSAGGTGGKELRIAWDSANGEFATGGRTTVARPAPAPTAPGIKRDDGVFDE
jgi:hypothetical protein